MVTMLEIVGARDRCTNLSLSSVGICLNTPAMNQMDVEYSLQKVFDANNVYTYHRFFRNDEWWLMIRIDHAPYKNMDRKILAKEISTVGRLVSYIKRNKIYGHFIIGVSGHSLAIHYLKNNKIYIVDNAEEFLSRRKIQFINIIDNASLDQVFMNFLEQNIHSPKIQEV